MRSEPIEQAAPRDRRAGAGGGGRKRRAPRKMTAARLERIAAAHLQRHASSVENLRRVLRRRIATSCAEHEQDAADFEAPLDELLARLERAGLLDDRRYAESLLRRGRARGASAREITARLRHKGVAPEVIAAVMHDEAGGSGGASAGAESDAAEVDAAWRYARRRRLGPYREDPELRRERRERDLAALGRRGFGYGTASRVIDGAPEDAPGRG